MHDDNSARDAVVKRKIKEADAVWIVSNIVRAVNDKTAKDLLGEHFRRQLLMDGQFGALAFVATQAHPDHPTRAHAHAHTHTHTRTHTHTHTHTHRKVLALPTASQDPPPALSCAPTPRPLPPCRAVGRARAL